MRARFFALWVFLLAVVSAHGQTLYGPGGLIINPTAYTDRAGFFELNASLFNRQTGGSTTSLYPISATYAYSNRSEVGLLYVGQLTGSAHNDMGGMFFKQGLTTERGSRPALALVGTALSGQGTTSTLTLIGSKEVVPGLHLHLGGRYVGHSFDSRADGNLIAGMDVTFLKNYKFIAEADSRLNIYPYGSLAFGVQYMGPIVVTVGTVSQATGKYAFFVGVGYPVGKP